MLETMYGFFSEEAYRLRGYVVYLRPDGSEVQVTVIDRDPNYHLHQADGWKDMVPVGEVTEFVRNCQHGSEFRKDYEREGINDNLLNLHKSQYFFSDIHLNLFGRK